MGLFCTLCRAPLCISVRNLELHDSQTIQDPSIVNSRGFFFNYDEIDVRRVESGDKSSTQIPNESLQTPRWFLDIP